MFCPVCRSEFREGIARCPDCEVVLVAELLPDLSHDASDLAPLLTTADLPFLMVVKSLLAAEGIPCLVSGEEGVRLIAVLPSGGFGTPKAVSMTVFVRQADLQDARRLVAPPAEGP